MDATFLVDWPFGPVAGLVVGALLLFAGRRLFWFLVGAVGFLAGFYLAEQLLALDELWPALLVGILAGLAGAFLAVLLQRVAIGLAGFLVGGSAAVAVAEAAFGPQEGEWILFLVFGVLSAVILALVFEAALIVLSSLLGAAIVLDAAPVDGVEGVVPFLVLAALGMAAQSATRPRREGKRQRRRDRRRRRQVAQRQAERRD